MRRVHNAEIIDILALTPIQEGMLFYYLKEPESKYYYEQLSLSIKGKINLQLFEQAWDTVVETNEMLRTVFRWEETKNHIQIILSHHKLQPDFYDFSPHDAIEKKKLLQEVKTKDRTKKFDLNQVPFRVILCKMEDDSFEIIISNHHILYDGWSNGIILKEFFKAYDNLSRGRELIKPVKTKFKDFIKWIQGKDTCKQEEFWRNYLNRFDTQTVLPVKIKKGKSITGSESYLFRLERDLKDRLNNFCMANKITLVSFLYSTWGLLLQKYTNSDDVVFGTTVSGRSLDGSIPNIEDMVGQFINTIPLRVKTLTAEKVSHLIYRINKEQQMRQAYEHTPLVHIRKFSELDKKQELFDCVLVIENYPLDRQFMDEQDQLYIHSYSMVEITHYNLSIAIMIHDDIEFNFTYHQEFFDEDVIAKLAEHTICITTEILENPDQKVIDIEIISRKEREQILYEFNNTSANFPKNKTVHQLFEDQVEITPDRIALVGRRQRAEDRIQSTENYKVENIEDNARTGEIAQITYRELNEKSNRLAYWLKEKGVEPDTIVGIMIERLIEVIIGILGILKSGGAYLPIDIEYPQKRIDFILKDSSLEILVNDEVMIESDTDPNQVIQLNKANSSNLAYVIYTSGSTGKPKGILINHFSVLNCIFFQVKYFNIEEYDRILQFSSISFDASVEQIFTTLSSGAVLVLIDKNKIMEEGEFEIYIANHCITHLHAVPSFLNHINLENFYGLKRIIAGGDVCPISLAEKFSRHCDFYNEYGPTETTVTSLEMKVNFEDINEVFSRLPVGKPINNTVVYLLDKWMKIVPVRVVGELYIGGEGLGRGYLNNPELTAEKFLKNPFVQGEILFRTGDLVRWLPDGNIEFLGRMDNQVKIRGFRIELGEIESYLVKHNLIKDAVVLSRVDSSGENYLCAYFIARSHDILQATLTSELREYLLKKLPDYMIPTYFVRLESIPLTFSGKIDRNVRPEPEIKKGVQYIPPCNQKETKLIEIWASVLRIKKDQIGINNNFFHLGGHSLKAIDLISKINKEFNVKVSLTEIFKRPTIRELAECIGKTNELKCEIIKPVEEKEYYELSSAQKRLYFLQRMNSISTSYNMPMALVFKKGIDKEKLDVTIKKLIVRHESLRTSFVELNAESVQRIHSEVNFVLNYEEVNDDVNYEDIFHRFIRPFDLSKPSLIRSGLIKLPDSSYVWMVDMHHIISDGVSCGILINDFTYIYKGNESQLSELKIQYKDYSECQQYELKKEILKNQGMYWLEQFEGEIPVLNLPCDYTRPSIQSFEGLSIEFEINEEDSKNLTNMVKLEGVTLFMVLLSIFSVYLSKLSQQEDIIVGTPTVGRMNNELDFIIGMFVNTLALRNYPTNEKSFAEFIEEVKQRSSEALENQDYPFDELVEKLEINRDVSRNPLFDVLLVLESFELSAIEMPGLEPKHYKYDNRTAKFDLSLSAVEKGDKLFFSFEYCTRLFKKETIDRLITYFKRVLSSVLKNPKIKILEIEIISEEEKHRILYDFNNTAVDYPKDKTIHQLFEEQVYHTPDRKALAGIWQKTDAASTDNEEIVQISYRELNDKSEQIAYLLKKKGVESDTIIAIKTERSIEMIIGLLGILKSGGAYLPIEPQYPQERIDYFLKDSSAKILVTFRILEEEKSGREKEENKNREIMFIDSLEFYSFPTSPRPHVLSSNASILAYIIYTSGTTGRPKGVMTTHQNVVNQLTWFGRMFNLNLGTHALQLNEYYFDPSVEDIFGTILYGGVLHIGNKEVVANKKLLRQFVEKFQVNILNFVPTMLKEYLFDGETLKSLKVIVSGGEKLEDSVKNGILKKGYKLYNNYGPTETTIDALSSKCSGRNVTLGGPISNIRCYILTNNKSLAGIGFVGELNMSGDGLARGYLNNPESTAEKFQRNPFVKGEILYRTGDLVQWLPDGNIDFLGRMDNQVKIRGFRIELGEIQAHLMRHDSIKEAVVVARENNSGEMCLCAYVVLRSTDFSHSIIPTKLGDFLSRQLPHYMIPSYFIPVDRIPLTPSGKINREELPEPEIKTGKDYVPPRTSKEKKLVKIWSSVLHIKKEQIGIDNDFFRLGGHSLKATSIISKINTELNVKVPLKEIFKSRTIRKLAEYIGRTKASIYENIRPIEKKEYYELSSAQKRLYVLQRIDSTGTGYNMPMALAVGKDMDIDKDKLDATIKKLIARHESLRTSFQMLNDVPVQRVHNEVNFVSEYEEVNDKIMVQNKFRRFIRPFDLSQAPLIRSGLIKLPNRTYVWMVDMHHIISDGTSHMILTADFDSLYNDNELAFLRLQYKDYSHWQNHLSASGTLKDQEDYWLGLYSGEIPRLSLPTDVKRPGVFTFVGERYEFQLGSDESERFKTINTRIGGTLYMNILATLNILISKYTAQTDIIIGTVTAGRQHEDLQGILGMFVNTLVIRNYPEGEKTYESFLKEVINQNLNAFENQDFQFEKLVEKLKLEKDISRNPLFDIMLADQNFDRISEDIIVEINNSQIEILPVSGKRLTFIDYGNCTSKFDMTFLIHEKGEEVRIEIDYNNPIFKHETIKRLALHFRNIIHAVIQHPCIKLKDIEITSEEERKQIIYAFNDTVGDYPKNKNIHLLFEEQVERAPENMSVVGASLAGGSIQLSYRELNEKSNRLAKLLREQGVEPDSIVCIIIERSIEMIIGIMGILKAGGAYFPINPDYPKERIDFMLKDSGTRVLFTSRDIEEKTRGREEKWKNVEIIFANDSYLSKFLVSPFPCFLASGPSNFAYIIYTSGSTGIPKGVPITHGNLCPLLHWGYDYIGWGSRDHVIQTLAYYFDWSALEIFLTLTSGACLYMISEKILLNADVQLDFIKRHDITVMETTPTRFQSLIASDPEPEALETLRCLCIGAEKLTVNLVKHARELIANDCRVFNLYGPTEATIISAALEIDMGALKMNEYLSGIPIGRIVGNGSLLVLDKYLNICPVNLVGELYITGDGVGVGYLNNPELTAEKFCIRRPGNLFEKNIHDGQNSWTSQNFLFSLPPNFYKTGDLARWLPNGNIEFLGRIDNQVKIRGFRIELEEIESHLVKDNLTKEAVVLSSVDSSGQNYLYAYIIPRSQEILHSTLTSELREYLSRRLPAYMIPSYFVSLDRIPLTPNGKIDRKALPEPKLIGGKNYIAPGDELEKKLVQIWSELLSPTDTARESIGIDDNFFHLGGHSLKATIMISKIRKEMNVEVPLVEVFKKPTIRQLAEYIGKNLDKSVGSVDNNLVPLKKANRNVSQLFFIHDGTGEVEGYIEFCNHPDNKLNCWGIRADGIKNYTPQDRTIEEIAGKYVEKTKKIQPHGPYSIAGWSLGGTIAFEMVKQLEKNGEKTAFLGLFDSPGPGILSVQDNREFTIQAELDYIREYFPDRKMNQILEKVTGIEELWIKMVDYLGKNDTAAESIKKIIAEYGLHYFDFDQASIKELIHSLNVTRTLLNARDKYRPSGRIKTRVHYFEALESKEIITQRWDEYCGKGIDYYTIPGDHFSIFKMPHVEKFARIFKKALEDTYDSLSAIQT